MSEQTTVGQSVNEQKGITHKKVIVMFERSTGDIVLVDETEDGSFFRGATVNHGYIVLAFLVPVSDLEGKSGRPSKIQRMKSASGVYGFFKSYSLTKL